MSSVFFTPHLQAKADAGACGTAGCTEAKCCEDAPADSCVSANAGVTCPVEQRFIQGASCVVGVNCTVATCCTARTCATEGVICPTGFEVRSAVLCLPCCDLHVLCPAYLLWYTCTASRAIMAFELRNLHFQTPPQRKDGDIVCGGSVCPRDTCCQAIPTIPCPTDTCSGQYKDRSQAVCTPSVNCDVSTCCITKTCAADFVNQCPSGYEVYPDVLPLEIRSACIVRKQEEVSPRAVDTERGSGVGWGGMRRGLFSSMYLTHFLASAQHIVRLTSPHLPPPPPCSPRATLASAIQAVAMYLHAVPKPRHRAVRQTMSVALLLRPSWYRVSLARWGWIAPRRTAALTVRARPTSHAPKPAGRYVGIKWSLGRFGHSFFHTIYMNAPLGCLPVPERFL